MEAPTQSNGKAIAGVVILIISILIVGGFIGLTVYMYSRWKHSDSPKSCNNGNIQVPQTKIDAVGCMIQGNYNVYPGAAIKTPASPKQAFAPTDKYKDADMTAKYCGDMCSATDGCSAYICTVQDHSINPIKCVCTGYTQLPTSLQQDTSSGCVGKGNCTTVGVKSSAV